MRWAARLGPMIIRALARTWRLEIVNAESYLARRRSGQPVIFAFWHANMLPLLWEHRQQGIAVLISTHADGEIIARICEALGYRTIRGSTSRGGARALVEVARTLQGGVEVAITPDGPRGPVHTVAPGVVYAAQRTSVPIVPIDVRAARAWRLATWDRFMIPKPFSRITIRYGDPFVVEQSDTALMERESERLGATLRALEGANA